VGLTSYDAQDGRKIVPHHPQRLHAVPTYPFERRPTRTKFLAAWDYRTSWCGITVKVLLPTEFEDDAPDACPVCARALATGERPPDESEAQVQGRSKSREKVFLAFERYEEHLRQTLAGTEIERELIRRLPNDPGLRHAASLYAHYPHQDRFLDRRTPIQAWCGRWCWVVTPDGFFEDDATACPECAKAWARGFPNSRDRHLGSP